jgi:hypothetical protein
MMATLRPRINSELTCQPQRPQRSVDYFLPYTRHNYAISKNPKQSFAIQTHGETASIPLVPSP